jgi:hypothetical protein
VTRYLRLFISLQRYSFFSATILIFCVVSNHVRHCNGHKHRSQRECTHYSRYKGAAVGGAVITGVTETDVAPDHVVAMSCLTGMSPRLLRVVPSRGTFSVQPASALQARLSRFSRTGSEVIIKPGPK